MYCSLQWRYCGIRYQRFHFIRLLFNNNMSLLAIASLLDCDIFTAMLEINAAMIYDRWPVSFLGSNRVHSDIPCYKLTPPLTVVR